MTSCLLRLPIIGNDGMASLVHPWNELFRQHHSEVQFDCTLEGSSTAMMALATDASWVAPMSRAPWPHELAAFSHVKGYLPTAIHVGYTGHGPRADAKSPPALHIHRSNPLSGLTMAQVSALFGRGNAQGEIRNWSQLGLQGQWQQRRIHLYGLRDDGKYATAFRHLHLGGLPFPPHYEALADRQSVIAAVAEDPYGLGCIGWFDAAAFADRVKMVPLAADQDSPFCTPALEHVRNGRYPLSSYVSLYFDLPPGTKLDPMLRRWLECTLSPAGQAIVAAQTHSAEGYVPLEETMLAEQKRMLALL